MGILEIIKDFFIINNMLDFLIILLVFIACFEIFILLKYQKNKGRNIIKKIIIMFLLLFIAFVLLKKHLYQEEIREKIISRQESLERRWKEEGRTHFNEYYEKYAGIGTITDTKELLLTTKTNFYIYKKEPERIPTIIFYTKEENETVVGSATKKTLEGKPYLSESDDTLYLNDIDEIRNMIKERHSYIKVFREDEDKYVRAFAIGDVTNMTENQINVAKETMYNELMQLELYEK
jgi:hypothetical protein